MKRNKEDNKMFWYEKKAEGKDVCVSTRVRLARNLKDFPFKARLTDEKAAEIVSTMAEACASAAKELK